MEKQKAALKSLELQPDNGFSPSIFCRSFAEANQALARYNQNYWEHSGECVKCKVQWDKDLSYQGSFCLPDDNTPIEAGYLEQVLQDTLEDELFMLPASSTLREADAWMRQPRVLYAYTVRRKDFLGQCYRLLTEAEGFDHERFRAKDALMEKALNLICLDYPFIRTYMLDTQDLLNYSRRLVNRSKRFKRFLFAQIENLTLRAYALTLSGPGEHLHKLQARLEQFMAQLEREKPIHDERFTYLGFQLYHMFPLDRLELCPSPHALTDAQAEDYVSRMEAVRLAPPVGSDIDQQDSRFFYSHYAEALDRVLALPEAARSHRQASLLAARACRKHGVEDKALSLMLKQYDPYAIGYDDYGKMILSLLNIPNLNVIDA